MLSPPNVIPPVTPCTRALRVRGQLAGAEVVITDEHNATIADGAVAATEDVLLLNSGVTLAPRQVLRARQTTNDDHSGPSPEGTIVLNRPTRQELGGLYTPEPLLECGRCVWVANVVPGATVSLTVGANAPLKLQTDSDTAKFTFPQSHASFAAGDRVVVTQEACGTTGPDVVLPPPSPQSRADWRAHAPKLGDLAECQRAVYLERLLPGCTVVLERSDEDEEERACFAVDRGWFWLRNPLHVGVDLSARIEFPTCELIGSRFDARVENRQPSPPLLLGPICRGDRYVTAEGTIPGAILRFFADDQLLCRAGGSGGRQVVAVPPLAGVSRLTVAQSVCGGALGTWSAPSNTVWISKTARRPTSVLIAPVFAAVRR